MLKMSFGIDFSGFSTTLPTRFGQYYLGMDRTSLPDAREISVKVDIELKRSALVSAVGWRYYGWVDSFLRTIDEVMSAKAFFKKIGWETALTTIQWERSSKAKHRLEPTLGALSTQTFDVLGDTPPASESQCL